MRHEPAFPLAGSRAHFKTIDKTDDALEPDELRLMTMRSEGQFNTVVYEEHDRYRNQPSRDVILMNELDINAQGFSEGDRVVVTSETGEMRNVRIAAYDIARHCAAMYYPEANVLVRRVSTRRVVRPPLSTFL